MPAIVVPAFALAWWAACYLIGRDPARRAPQRAAAALVAYGIAVVLWTVEPDSAAAQIVICVPALLWAGAAIGLHPERRYLDRGWLIVSGVFLVVVIALPQAGRLVALAPLAGALVLLWRARTHVRPPMLPAAMAVAAVLYAVALAVILRLDIGFESLVLAAIGVDLLMLGFLVCVAEALELGERLRPDLVRAVTGGIAGSIVAGGLAALTMIAADDDLLVTIVQYVLVAVVMTLIGLSPGVQRGLDTVAFFDDPRLREARSGLRRLGDALPRRRPRHRLPRTGADDFVRFTGYALDNYRDDARLLRSPLIELPAVDRHVTGRPGEEPLVRVAALRAVLSEAVDRLRPPGQFATSDAWHHYSALHFCSVLGVNPKLRRLRTDGLDREARQALSWMHQYVPARVLRRWQLEGAHLVATHLRDDLLLPHQPATRR
ncbi:hypothetical protein HH310_33060 [Actinoplanes sp. TBRC 11911]|nr:hypothetical protein [Actinoplanes sp. TBRC 11911]